MKVYIMPLLTLLERMKEKRLTNMKKDPML